jgi:hypothetical protein
MNMKRTATMAVVAGALLAWLAGAATSTRQPAAAPAFGPAPMEISGAELASEVARLRERLRPVASPRDPGRNLFGFHTPPVRPTPAEAAPVPALSEARPAVIAQPSLKLSGIAEDPGPDGPVRVAFIAGEGQLFMVKEGDRIASRFRVNRISADVVELTDLADNSVRRLAMK